LRNVKQLPNTRSENDRILERDRRRYWSAVTNRDARFDGAFVYAVRSTGIYCRPGCPSRRPQRAVVEFFAAPESAERAGFRACLRCRPKLYDASERIAAESRGALVRRICREIEGNAEEPIRLETLAARVGLGSDQLSRIFRRAVGITPRQYADAARLGRLKRELRAGGTTVTTALYEAGYGSSSRLYEQSNAQLGMTPAAYRRGGGGMEITYTIATSRLGRVLVGATPRGISAVYLGDRDAPLADALRREYPHAEIRPCGRDASKWVRAIVRYLDAGAPSLDLPLDVQATAFQRRVWEALRRIPRGTTRSYGAIARAMGRPKAARAVARACATNPVSLVIPCHRVVREDGGLGGYRWGIERKKALLAQESAGDRNARGVKSQAG
jgi:AraC family transcriptional regulator, regulatory protein of adaptative response / methylated-DNA-[protein]-cysteine methyltransferase